MVTGPPPRDIHAGGQPADPAAALGFLAGQSRRVLLGRLGRLGKAAEVRRVGGAFEVLEVALHLGEAGGTEIAQGDV